MKDSGLIEVGCGCIVMLMVILGFSALGALILMYLWNWLAPLFWQTAPILTFWQTWGIVFLLSLIGNLLFKSGSKND